MTKLAYVGGVAVAALLATTAVSYAKDEKPAVAQAEKKAAAPAQPTPAPAAKPEAAKPATPAGAPAMKPGEAKPAPGTPATPPAGDAAKPAPPKMEQPKPAPEIATVFKQMQGTWKCSGTGSDPSGKSMAFNFTMNFKQDLDKFWIVGTMASKKTKEMPMIYKFTEYTTYDAASKKWTRLMMDNMGGWEQATSNGMTNNQMSWEGKGSGMGMSYTTKHVQEMKGPRETHVAGQMSMDGKNWMPMYDATCKK